jgi:hypothetical protein
MEYNAEQRRIIQRIGNLSAQFDEMAAAHRAVQAAASSDIVNLLMAVANLVTAIEQSRELGILQKQYGEAFREFLDTL